MTEFELKKIVLEICDDRYRKKDDCDKISDEIRDDVLAVKTDVAVVKSLLKGILAVAAITAGFIIPACLRIILGVEV